MHVSASFSVESLCHKMVFSVTCSLLNVGMVQGELPREVCTRAQLVRAVGVKVDLGLRERWEDSRAIADYIPLCLAPISLL